MAKIILTLNGEVLREVELSRERITIGRAPHNDLVIDNRAVSGEHAVIVTVNDDSFLEDLNSTNGTQVNGQPIKKHFLQEDDVIELAQYRLRYLTSLEGENSRPLQHIEPGPGNVERLASIRILNGPNVGKKTIIDKPLITIGHPSTQVAVISRRSAGYFIVHIEGTGRTRVNERTIQTSGELLIHGDVIDLAGVQMQFLLP